MKHPKIARPQVKVSLRPIPVWIYLSSLLVIGLFVTGYYTSSYFQASTEQEIELLVAGYAFFLLYLFTMLFRFKAYIFDPILLLGITVLLGVILKVPYLILNPLSMNELLAGKSIQIFIDGTYIVAVAITLFLLSFLLTQIFRNKNQREYVNFWNTNKLLYFCLALTCLTGLSALLAINQIGIGSLFENFSQKRFLELEGASGRLGSSLYYYYKIALLAKTTAYLCLVYILTTPKPRKHNTLFIAMFFISLIISTITPTIFNARAQAILVGLDIAAIAYFSGFRIKMRYILGISLSVYGLLAYTTLSRVGEDRYTTVLDSILSRRYLLDISKTAQIFDHFKNNNDWFYGETLIGWMFVPIPSSIYANKPMFVDMGKWIGRTIFDYEISGVPPGYVGELYLNFGLPGIIVGMLLMGLVIGIFWKWFIIRSFHPVILVFGSMVLIRFAVFLFNNDLGTFIIKIGIEALPTVMILYLVSNSSLKAPAPHKN